MSVECALSLLMIWTEAAFCEGQLRRIDIDHPYLAWHQGSIGKPNHLKEYIERSTDILLSLVLLAAALFPMLVIAVLIKLDSPGPPETAS